MKEMVKKVGVWGEQTSRALMLKLNSERKSSQMRKVAREMKVKRWSGTSKISKTKSTLKRSKLPSFCPESTS